MNESPSVENVDCDLCIVGAGYAGLNGLNAAASYLSKGARVVVVDKKETWGGQWLHQYDFVRLQQPYRMFTAGDQSWTLARDPSYLATRREVLDHLASVPAVSAGHLEIKPLFGHAYVGHRIRDGRAQIAVESVSRGQRPVLVRARRMLKAIGMDIHMLMPFPLSSTRVRSVGVSDPVLRSPEFLESSAPVYVIGSGKTAMECVRHLSKHNRSRHRAINLVLGSGMWFLSRDRMFPRGRLRHTSGILLSDCFLRMSEAFNGQNEEDVIRGLESEGSIINVFGSAGNLRYGLLSFAERDQILTNTNQIHRGHLVDVDGTRMILREGKTLHEIPVADGSWFINCTTHLKHFPHENVLQDSGVVCAPQYALAFTGTTAYYLTHLWYREELASIAAELYRLRVDILPRLRFAPQMSVMVLANMMMTFARLPPSIPARFRGDFSSWYPLHRRLPMLVRLLLSKRRVLRKAEQVLKLRFSDSPDAD